MTALDRSVTVPLMADAMVGIWTDITHEDYITDPVPGGSLSSTGARKLLPPSCPAKFAWHREHPETKREFDMGHLAHFHVLGRGPEIVRLDYPSWQYKDAKTGAAEAHARGAVPVLEKEWAVAVAMAEALRRDRLASTLLTDAYGLTEVTLIDRDPVTGVMCRARLDFLRSTPLDGIVAVDYKSATKAEPGALSRSMADWGYHMQAQWHTALLRSLDLADADARFAFVVQEKEPPYLATVYLPDAEALRIAAERNARAREIYRDCAASGIWPGYSDEPILVGLPRWAVTEHLRESYE